MAKIPEPNAFHQFLGKQLWESPPGSGLMFNGEGTPLGQYQLNPDGTYDPVPLSTEAPVDLSESDVEAVPEVHEEQEKQEQE